jgi:chromosome segregation ATPase
MSPEEENGKLLKLIANRVQQTGDGLIRVEGRLENLNEKVEKLDKNIDIIRTSQQQTGTEVAIIQAENVQRKKQISGIVKKVDRLSNGVSNVEHTGKMFVIQTKQTWRTITIVGAIFVTVAGLALTIAKLVL